MCCSWASASHIAYHRVNVARRLTDLERRYFITDLTSIKTNAIVSMGHYTQCHSMRNRNARESVGWKTEPWSLYSSRRQLEQTLCRQTASFLQTSITRFLLLRCNRNMKITQPQLAFWQAPYEWPRYQYPARWCLSKLETFSTKLCNLSSSFRVHRRLANTFEIRAQQSQWAHFFLKEHWSGDHCAHVHSLWRNATILLNY